MEWDRGPLANIPMVTLLFVAAQTTYALMNGAMGEAIRSRHVTDMFNSRRTRQNPSSAEPMKSLNILAEIRCQNIDCLLCRYTSDGIPFEYRNESSRNSGM